MMNLKLDTDPLISPPSPKPEIAPQPTQAPDAPAAAPLFGLAVPLFGLKNRNACDVIGCKKYGHAFPSQQALLEHARAVHHRAQRGAAPKPGEGGQPKSMNMETPAATKTYKCKHCDFTADSWHELGPHVRFTHPGANLSKPKRAKLMVKVGNAYKYPCPHCPELLSNKTTLRNHIARAHSAPQTAAGGPDVNFRTAELRKPTPVERGTSGPDSSLVTRHSSQETTFIRFTGTKAQCGQVAMLLLENGFNNLNTGEI